MPDEIKGAVPLSRYIKGRLSSFMYLNPYIVAQQNGYTGTFDEWVKECVSIGDIVSFEIDKNGNLIGTYDDSKMMCCIDSSGNLNVNWR